MPEITPVVARGPPESRARMRLSLGGDCIFQHPQDFHLEFLDFIAFEDGSPHAFQAGATSLSGKIGGLAWPSRQLARTMTNARLVSSRLNSIIAGTGP